ncbi:hypothetical protein CFT13S00388_02655 [Campylobacter fetus subsp. testudinum]|uniref:hypothetical protein n=1 Tax=Campylobacter fetus TaxID=196 RepID=UPI000818C3FC|nr:hypothetical protein [Campylobacter fetus]OCR88085.1 hypothetical protein CFT13S00388_02655 [Campylobacter fetus subsp. testudinum]
MQKIAVFDIETEDIPDLVTNIKTIYCIAIKINDEPTKCYTYRARPYSDGNLLKALKILNSCDLIIGHNIVKFDIPIISNLLGKITAPIVDTLLDAKLVYPKDVLMSIDYSIKDFPSSLVGSYSLKAFGYRFNLNKIDYHDFSSLCEDMIVYCKRDVDLTYELYKHLSSHKYYPSKQVREVEYEFARCIYDQQEYGFYFDIDKAYEYATKLKFKKMNIEHTLLKVFKPIFVPDGEPITPAKVRNVKQYIDMPMDTMRNLREFKIPLKVAKNGRYKFPPKSMKYKTAPYRVVLSNVGGEYQKIKLQRFNPGSRSQVVDRLMKEFNWKPKNYTEKGSIKLEFERDEDEETNH